MEFVAPPQIHQRQIAGLNARNIVMLHDRKFGIRLAQQVIIVRLASRDRGLRSIDVLRCSQHPIDADRFQLSPFEAGLEMRCEGTGHIHFQKALADGANPVIEALARRHDTGRPFLYSSPLSSCYAAATGQFAMIRSGTLVQGLALCHRKRFIARANVAAGRAEAQAPMAGWPGICLI